MCCLCSRSIHLFQGHSSLHVHCTDTACSWGIPTDPAGTLNTYAQRLHSDKDTGPTPGYTAVQETLVSDSHILLKKEEKAVK